MTAPAALSPVAPISAQDLPGVLPIFPLSGALLLPRGNLPLNIFEPRYLAMTRDAMAGDGVFGMVQPRLPESQTPDDDPPIYGTGCAGRIVACAELGAGASETRLAITLSGLCRFDIVEELPRRNGYRLATTSYESYLGDLDAAEDADIDRGRLLAALSGYFEARGLAADLEAIEGAPNEGLVNALAMICPFAVNEKQALLESPNLGERARVMIAILELSRSGGGGMADGPRH